MTQEQLKEQFKSYAINNLESDTILQAICDLLDGISNELYESGYVKESNTLTTCMLSIKKIIESDKVVQ